MLGEAFRAYREARSLSEQRLATLLGVTDTYIRQIESGMRRQISWDFMCRSARALRVPLYKLVEAAWNAAPPLAELHAAGLPEDRQAQIARLWPRVPSRLRPTALQAAFALARVETVLDSMTQGRDS